MGSHLRQRKRLSFRVTISVRYRTCYNARRQDALQSSASEHSSDDPFFPELSIMPILQSILDDLHRRIKTGFALLVALCVTGLGHAADKTIPYAVKTVKDIVYHDGPDQHKVKHKLDLYLPEGVKDFPVLFFVHGGAWMHGDKDFFGVYSLFGRSFARLGIGVVVTNYRLSPEVKHPEHVKDVARAFAWTYRNIARYGGRVDQLFLCGHSAGAHLVALLTTDPEYLQPFDLTCKAIRGVIPVSGPFYFRDGFLTHVFGKSQKEASPLNHVREELPPFLILCAERDLPACDDKMAHSFCKALRGKGNAAEVIVVKGTEHISILASVGAADALANKAVREFIRKHTAQ
jgi:acetyl esterase/lipase